MFITDCAPRIMSEGLSKHRKRPTRKQLEREIERLREENESVKEEFSKMSTKMNKILRDLESAEEENNAFRSEIQNIVDKSRMQKSDLKDD